MEHGLDGVDFDWEYPAAPDLPDIPAGLIQEGQDYLEFLRAVKRRLRTKSVSIAAPASYWYLKGYPMKDIGAVVDYVIYMTYDLHGQWDYGNKWASAGCEEGNCLRSHVNLTETTNALAMITRAGISANKVFVGVTSYGRSFKMAQEGCFGDMCRFLGAGRQGKTSLAAKGLSMPILPNLEIELVTAMSEIGLSTWEGSNSAVVEGLSMPILMMAQAVNGMAQAKEIGDDWEKKENKNLILTIITAVLFFVPAVGQFSAAAAGLVKLARVFAAVGGICGLGMRIIDIVENPESAPLAIASMMLGAKIRTQSEYAVAAGLRRGMSEAVMEGMGKLSKDKNNSLTNIVRVCRRS